MRGRNIAPSPDSGSRLGLSRGKLANGSYMAGPALGVPPHTTHCLSSQLFKCPLPALRSAGDPETTRNAPKLCVHSHSLHRALPVPRFQLLHPILTSMAHPLESVKFFIPASLSPYCLLQSPRTFSYIHLSFYYESYFYPKTLRRSLPPLESAVHFASQSHMFIGTLRRLLPRPTLTEPIRPGRPEPPGDTTVLLKD